MNSLYRGIRINTNIYAVVYVKVVLIIRLGLGKFLHNILCTFVHSPNKNLLIKSTQNIFCFRTDGDLEEFVNSNLEVPLTELIQVRASKHL